MRNALTLAIILAGATIAQADETKPEIVPQINASGNIIVEQPEALGGRLQFDEESQPTDKTQRSDQRATAIGYRVEIFADNNARTAKNQAMARRRNVSSRLPEYATYMVFESPYWRVRVGDFRSRSEAENAMAEIRRAFPAYAHDLRIIRARIKN